MVVYGNHNEPQPQRTERTLPLRRPQDLDDGRVALQELARGVAPSGSQGGRHRHDRDQEGSGCQDRRQDLQGRYEGHPQIRPLLLNQRPTWAAAFPLLHGAITPLLSGGSNSSRSRTWKLHLQDLADELGMAITVCHYPPGTSKWNKIEHRLFSFISLTWKGQPLINYETVVNLIGATKTKSGLKVKAVLDTNEYETGVKVTKSEMDALRIRQHNTHPDWNYTIAPRS